MPDTHPPAASVLDASGRRAYSRFAALRALLQSDDLAFLMEAHSGLSARIVEEAGFTGIWASGLSISATLGLRDANEASWTQVLEQLEYMADAVRLPILADGDTGYGDFNNVRRLVRKLTERGVAGVCIEDKLFPKTNSFIGEAQPLADIEEFCGRIKAGKDSQPDDDFCLVARTEALISGRGMDEALRRAEAYHAAGADAVLVHSKKSTAAEISGFMERWGGRCPVVIVPTMYHATPTDLYRRLGISLVIWANHMVRASITGMRQAAERIHADQSLRDVEGRIASVSDIFRLVGNQELDEASRRYLPAAASTRAIVLAASRGSGLGEITAEQPKCMIDIRGQPLLRRLVDTLNGAGIREVAVVRGFRRETIALSGIVTVDNAEYATTGEAASLSCAAARLEGETVIVYGDVLFRRYILDGLLGVPGDMVIVVDALGAGVAARPNPRDLVRADRPFSAAYMDDAPVRLERFAAPDGQGGEWIGLMRVSAQGAAWLREELAAMERDGTLALSDLPAVIARVARSHPVHIHYITAHWLDVDTMGDLADARNFP